MNQLMNNAEIEALISSNLLPKNYQEGIHQYLIPLAQSICQHHEQFYKGKTWYIGLQGTQGSGKSTTAEFLRALIEQYPLSVTIVSIDDFYLTHQERIELSESVHPLLKTRGVPGTHDVQLAMDTLTGLSQEKVTNVPHFDKAMDDRSSKTYWEKVHGAVDIVIFEGWCVGLPAQSESELKADVNELEANEDSDHQWRQYVNEKLAGEYQALYALLDDLIVLQAPDFDCVYEWRLLQEEKLKKAAIAEGRSLDRIQSPEQIKRFISHYQRLTEHGLQNLKDYARWILKLNNQHEFTELVDQKPKFELGQAQQKKGGEHE